MLSPSPKSIIHQHLQFANSNILRTHKPNGDGGWNHIGFGRANCFMKKPNIFFDLTQASSPQFGRMRCRGKPPRPKQVSKSPQVILRVEASKLHGFGWWTGILWVFPKNRDMYPKMDGSLEGKTPIRIDDLGGKKKKLFLENTHITNLSNQSNPAILLPGGGHSRQNLPLHHLCTLLALGSRV